VSEFTDIGLASAPARKNASGAETRLYTVAREFGDNSYPLSAIQSISHHSAVGDACLAGLLLARA
jgi:hypothetical protein